MKIVTSTFHLPWANDILAVMLDHGLRAKIKDKGRMVYYENFSGKKIPVDQYVEHEYFIIVPEDELNLAVRVFKSGYLHRKK